MRLTFIFKFKNPKKNKKWTDAHQNFQVLDCLYFFFRERDVVHDTKFLVQQSTGTWTRTITFHCSHETTDKPTQTEQYPDAWDHASPKQQHQHLARKLKRKSPWELKCDSNKKVYGLSYSGQTQEISSLFNKNRWCCNKHYQVIRYYHTLGSDHWKRFLSWEWKP